jgi:hypothetical protein
VNGLAREIHLANGLPLAFTNPGTDPCKNPGFSWRFAAVNPEPQRCVTPAQGYASVSGGASAPVTTYLYSETMTLSRSVSEPDCWRMLNTAAPV